MKDKAKDKTRVVFAGIIAALVILGSLLLMVALLAEGENIQLVLPAGIVVIIVLFMVPFVKRRWFDVKRGFPSEDERSKKVMTNASSKAYYVSLYWLLLISFSVEVLEIVEMDVGQAIGTGIVGMAVLFGIFFLYYDGKGDV